MTTCVKTAGSEDLRPGEEDQRAEDSRPTVQRILFPVLALLMLGCMVLVAAVAAAVAGVAEEGEAADEKTDPARQDTLRTTAADSQDTVRLPA